MGKTITIDPVTRIEGHAKITLQVDDHGEISSAQFHVTQFRGFEKFCEGRPFYEMPYLMERICGICPVSHLLASAKACDALLAVRVPPAAMKLRRVLNLAQIIQSHALSFFYLSAPDLLLGMDADPKDRNIFGVHRANPELARGGIRLRQFGQQVIETLAGKRIHPRWVVPGGVNEPLSLKNRDAILSAIPEVIQIAFQTLQFFKKNVESFREEIRTFATFPTLFMGLVTPDGRAGYYDGHIRFTDAHGQIVADNLAPADYPQYLGEAVEPFTFMKFPYYLPLGYPDGIYRVGPLARLNIIDRWETPLAQQEWVEFRALQRNAILSSFHYHYARLIEILYCIEHMQEFLEDPEILSTHVRSTASLNNLEGVGAAEAPRGTLIHHYRVDEQGRITWANLIIATNHNNLAMNRGILQAAQHFVRAEKLTEGMLNRVEAVIRAFDPCLSCSTHADGHIPLHIQLRAPDGHLLDEVLPPFMTHALILACGNPLRGDDAVALHLARSLREQFAGPEVHVHTTQQWTPELAEPLSRCDLAIFLDASQRFSPGFVHCESLAPYTGEGHALLTHSCNPALLLLLSCKLYNHLPKRAYLLTIGAQSFAFSFSLSSTVQKAIPEALSRVESILAGATYPPSVLHALSAR